MATAEVLVEMLLPGLVLGCDDTAQTCSNRIISK